MLESKFAGVEKLPRDKVAGLAIQGITGQRITQPRHMHTDLMCAPRQQGDIDEGEPATCTVAVPANHRPARTRGLARSHNSHPLTVAWVAGDRRLNNALSLREAPHNEGNIDLGNGSSLELAL